MLWGGKKLNFILQNAQMPNGISLQEALAGSAGTVYLGNNNVFLWSPQCTHITPAEAICDSRFCPLDKTLADKFITATAGMFLPTKAVILSNNSKKEIKKALLWFNLVLVPSKGIKNSPKDIFKNRILAYDAPNYIRNRQIGN